MMEELNIKDFSVRIEDIMTTEEYEEFLKKEFGEA